MKEGRLLIASPFPDTETRMTVANAAVRNRLVAALAERAVVVHAHEGSRTAGVVEEMRRWGVGVEGVGR